MANAQHTRTCKGSSYVSSLNHSSAFSWGMSLFGVKQLANILSSSDSSQPTCQAVAAGNAVTHCMAEQFSAVVRETFQTGDQLQRDMVDLLFGVLTLETCTPRRLTKVTFDMLRQSAEVGRWLMPGRENRLAWQECKNKLQAFDLFEHVDVVLSLPTGPDLSLTVLLAQADALGPYRAVWALEGLGRYYAETCWTHKGTPQHLLTADQVSAVSAHSLVPLHTGMGLSLADRLLTTVSSPCSDATSTSYCNSLSLCASATHAPGIRGQSSKHWGWSHVCAAPSWGSVDRQLAAIDPDLVGYFWHGVGLGCTFSRSTRCPVRDPAGARWRWRKARRRMPWADSMLWQGWCGP